MDQIHLKVYATCAVLFRAIRTQTVVLTCSSVALHQTLTGLQTQNTSGIHFAYWSTYHNGMNATQTRT